MNILQACEKTNSSQLIKENNLSTDDFSKICSNIKTNKYGDRPAKFKTQVHIIINLILLFAFNLLRNTFSRCLFKSFPMKAKNEFKICLKLLSHQIPCKALTMYGLANLLLHSRMINKFIPISKKVPENNRIEVRIIGLSLPNIVEPKLFFSSEYSPLKLFSVSFNPLS